MKKQLTNRQLWSTWENEYKLCLRAGYNHAAAVLKADAAVAAKQERAAAAMREAADANPDAEKRPD